jgi:hypothetical protein
MGTDGKFPKFLALSLIAGVLLLTNTAVCGSSMDVDPAACCKRHAPCEQMKERSDHSPKPEDCCIRGENSYPVANLRSTTAIDVVILQITVSAFLQSAVELTTAFRQGDFLDHPLKIPLLPVCLRSSVFRI